MGLVALLFSMCAAIFAEEPQANYKWDWETAFKSRQWEKDGAPKGLVDAWWASPSYNYKSGLLQKGVPRQHKHMHAMVIAVFYAKRDDQRRTAIDWLESYNCENIVACDRTQTFFDIAYKANVLTLKGQRASVLKKLSEKIHTRSKELISTRPSPSLCGKDSQRGKWLELEYALVCPIGEAAPQGMELCTACEAIKRMRDNIDMSSQQMVMSSSYLESLKHEGASDCNSPWEATLVCGGGSPQSFKYKCERTTSSSPLKIKCEAV